MEPISDAAVPLMSGTAARAPAEALLASREDAASWDEFVASRPDAANYHRWAWQDVIEGSFGWPIYRFLVREEGRITGVLPLVFQSSRVFGSFLTSLPFFNSGGILSSTPAAEQSLAAAAVDLARRLGVRSLELRHRQQHADLVLPESTERVTLVREVASSEELLWKSIDKKVRSDIRKSMSYQLTAEVRREPEAVAEFYPIFAANMRDVGTPVYSRRFFENIMQTFPAETFITLVRRDGKAIASSFLCGYRDTVEVPWSASLHEHYAVKPNMLLYWKNLLVTSEAGYRKFDFGRSWRESGTHRFKLQWQPEEIPLHWNHWAPGGEAPTVNVHNPKYRAAIAAWKRLPLAVANRLGPYIARCLP